MANNLQDPPLRNPVISKTGLIALPWSHFFRDIYKALTRGETEWTAPTLLNGWVDYSSGYPEPGYIKDSEGYVSLRGLVKNGTTTNGTTLFTLPVGYRPSHRFLAITISNDAVAEILIEADGNASLYLASASWFSLDNIRFKVA